MQAIRGRNRRYRGRRVPIQRTLRDFSDSPLCKLSRDLVSTYQTINNRYFETVQSNEDDRSNSYGNIAGEYEADSGRRQIMSIYNLENQERTLKNDHVPILDRYDFSFTQRVRGTIIGGRFRLEKFLGKGSFGIVVSATDLKTNTMVAIKMIKKHEHFSKLAQKELEVLQHISSLPEYDRKHIVRLLAAFEFEGHCCLAFEHLSVNLLYLLKESRYQGLRIETISVMGRQLANCLLTLKTLRIVHCDLKPENILLIHPKSSDVKVIDFGSSCFEQQSMYSYVQSRFYRAPEILLGIKTYGCAIDVWSLGCILMELFIGTPLFEGSDEEEQIHRIVALLGMPPYSVLKRGEKTSKYFIKSAKEYVLNIKNFAYLEEFPRTFDEVLSTKTNITNHALGYDLPDVEIFKDLLTKILVYDPRKRLKPSEILEHPFFNIGGDCPMDAEDINPTRYSAHSPTDYSRIHTRSYMRRLMDQTRPLCLNSTPVKNQICIQKSPGAAPKKRILQLNHPKITCSPPRMRTRSMDVK